MRILIGADLVVTENNTALFKAGDAEAIVGKEMLEEMQKADYRIFNLELALTDTETPIRKCGPNLGAPCEAINGYRALGVDLLGISNNHVADHGLAGFESTLRTLDAAGIAHVGGGMTEEEGRAPYIFEKDGRRIGVIAVCEHEFSCFCDYGFGSANFDPLETPDLIAETKKSVDYLIVLYHGGKEHYVYPSPYLRHVCRKMAEKGADIVLCQHTHCVGTEEDWCGGKIIYGQGNFVFAQKYADVDTWGDGFLVAADITDAGVTYTYIPYEMTDNGIRKNDKKGILEGLYSRSEEIKKEGFTEESFAKLAAAEVKKKYLRILFDLGEDEADDAFVEKYGLLAFHLAECEVHRESMITGLRNSLRLGKYGECKK